ncbi:hypothetical protein BDU57DRAFT_325824 [Ampelomyces quisqualis]|uniref:Uncharacterized protein n=1 Tax=Ampelomyces quisqualis TaxID=50730 RepID=A0A6A5QE15_AMPQU|nr:hypothetical protein BDU57DRAFT_325824 [Ampelomyces quisqualis]
MSAMTSTGSPLPTAWLAPPPGLVHSNQVTTIEPVPIAISATIALVVGAIIFILFRRKDKEIFLGDRITSAPETENPADASRHVKVRNNMPVNISAPQVLHLPPTQRTLTNPHSRFETPKINAVLGWKDEVESSHVEIAQPAPLAHQSYYALSRSQHNHYGSDDETLKNDEKNSAYVPYPRSDASYGMHDRGAHRFGLTDRAHFFDGESIVRRSPLSLASKTRLGDAY